MKHERFLADSCRAICALGAFVLIAGGSAALAQTPAKPADKMDSTMKGMPVVPAGGDMRASMMGMMKNLDSMKMTGDADRDFATMMKMHHQGAIDMARMELQSGKDAKMRAMAKRIIEAQQKEIKEFDRWLGKRK